MRVRSELVSYQGAYYPCFGARALLERRLAACNPACGRRNDVILAASCRTDVDRFCSSVEPGETRGKTGGGQGGTPQQVAFREGHLSR